MKKKLNIDAIMNELSQSRFFQRPQPTQQLPPPEQPKPQPPQSNASSKSATPHVQPTQQKTAMDYKVSVWISTQQFQQLADLKTEILRKYDPPFSKQTAFLAAITELIADYEKNGEQSLLIRSLKSRKHS
jgi:hypothetical protein